MENLNIQDIWKQNEQLLDRTRKLNGQLLRELKMDKAKASLKRLLFLPISTLVFYSILSSYALCFMVNHWGTWYFMLAGGAVAFFSTWLLISSIQQIKRILSLDYDAPILTLQSNLALLKTNIIQNLRIAAYLLPFGPFVGLFFFKVVFNVDLMQVLDYNMIVSFGVITIVLEVLSLLLLRALRPKNSHERWLNFLLQGSGSQVDEALGFLEQIKEFENNGTK